jgi:hypothetical protein
VYLLCSWEPGCVKSSVDGGWVGQAAVAAVVCYGLLWRGGGFWRSVWGVMSECRLAVAAGAKAGSIARLWCWG